MSLVQYDKVLSKFSQQQLVRESSFNMTRGGDEGIEGGLHTRRGGALKKLLG